MSATTTDIQGGGVLNLFLDQGDDGQVDSTVPVRWCISRETAEILQEKGVREPKLVIVVEHDGEEMDQYIVPLKTEMRYIRFRRPGKNTVHAAIMWDGMGNVENESDFLRQAQPKTKALTQQHKELNEKIWALEERDSKSEELVALRAEREGIETELEQLQANEPAQACFQEQFMNTHRMDGEVAIDVLVPGDMFAKKPPRWMAWLGHRFDSWMWEQEPRDQCDLRRRALITLAVIPFVTIVQLLALLVVEIVNLVITGTLLLYGMRNINFEPLRHPFKVMPKEIGSSLEPSIWWAKKGQEVDYIVSNRYDYTLRHPALLVINPPVVAGFSVIGLVLYRVLESGLFLVLGLAAAFVLGLLVTIIAMLAQGPIARAIENRKKQHEEEKEAQEQRDKDRLRQELEQLACSNASREVSISALPKDRQTVYLRFQALKSKVCKPFAA